MRGEKEDIHCLWTLVNDGQEYPALKKNSRELMRDDSLEIFENIHVKIS